MDDGIQPAGEEIPGLDFEDVRGELARLSEAHDCPEMVVAYDAVMDAIKAAEDKPELMQELSAAMAPLLAGAPMLIAKMMGMG
jgi:hypothetical protein